MRWPSVAAALLVTGCATVRPPLGGIGGSGADTALICGGLAQAGHWPNYDTGDEALLAPFLACASPAEFVELQRGVEMPRLVAALDDWSAVRLGAMGPLVAGADVLTRKRAAFLVNAEEKYGAPYAEVLALYVIDAAYDDELRALLELLATDKQLQQTLGQMCSARAELERRGLKRRLAELKAGKEVEGPLRWDGYQGMMGLFARGLEFQRMMTDLLRADAKLRRPLRRWLGDFEQPSIETNVGVAKPGVEGVRYADVLVSEGKPGLPPRVETFSFKSRDFSGMTERRPIAAQMKADAAAALRFYGETLDIRRPSLKRLGPEVQVRRVRLVYEGGELKPGDPDVLPRALDLARSRAQGVEVDVQ